METLIICPALETRNKDETTKKMREIAVDFSNRTVRRFGPLSVQGVCVYIERGRQNLSCDQFEASFASLVTRW